MNKLNESRLKKAHLTVEEWGGVLIVELMR